MKPITHYNSWTGRPCNCPWGPKKHISKTAGQELNKILKAPDKAFQTPEGQQFKQALPRAVGEEHDSLAPYIAQRWKKGDIQYHPGHRDPERQIATESGLYYRNGYRNRNTDSDFEAKPVATHNYPHYQSGWSRLDPRTLSGWNQWYQAKQHPTRRGVNVMHPDFTPNEMGKKVTEHEEALRKEELLKHGLNQGDIVHKFPNGWHVRHLTSPGTDVEDALGHEGNAMGHCIGSDEQPYMKAALSGDTDVYSLRDKKGWPHGTWNTNSDGSIAEIHGNDNKSLSDEQQEMYEEWAMENGYHPAPVGFDYEDPDQGDEYIEIPGATDIDTYKDHFHPNSNNEYYEDADQYGIRGEDTEIYPGEPDWTSVAEDLENHDPKERQDFYNTVANAGLAHHRGLKEELEADPDLHKYLKELEENHNQHWHPRGGYSPPDFDWRTHKWETAKDRVNRPLWNRPGVPETLEDRHFPGRPEIEASRRYANAPQIVELGLDEVRKRHPFDAMETDLLQSRRPFVYHPDDNQVVIGPRGVFHRQIDPNHVGKPGAILMDNKFNQGQDSIRSWGKIPYDVLEHISDHVGVPIHPEEQSGWKFGNEHEWGFSQPHVTTKFPEDWLDSYRQNETNGRGRSRIPFVWTHHPDDHNDVKLYMGHPGSYHDQLGEMHNIPFEESVGGYGSVKPRSYQTGNREDRDQHIEYYTVDDPRAMGSVADELTKHFEVANQGFKNEPYQKGDPDDPDYDYEMQQVRFGATEWPEPINPKKRLRAIGLHSGEWHQWPYEDEFDNSPAHAEYLIENDIHPDEVKTYAMYSPDKGWYDYGTYRDDYKDIYNELKQEQQPPPWKFATEFRLPDPHPDFRGQNDDVKPEEIEPWEKGHPGKFTGLPNGQVLTWRNQLSPHYYNDDENPEWKYDGWPSHHSVLAALGHDTWDKGMTFGQIRPNGEIIPYAAALRHELLPQHLKALKEKHPETFPNLNRDWKFANA